MIDLPASALPLISVIGIGLFLTKVFLAAVNAAILGKVILTDAKSVRLSVHTEIIDEALAIIIAVSYTHLTLPTIYSV